jgi:hypothetical protein
VRRHQDTGGYRTECVGFGINLLSGNYEFACLILIDDEEWWARFGSQVEANWEIERIRLYSSRDTAGLRDIMRDPRWSNEGLFALAQGLRRLAELDRTQRVAAPRIEVGHRMADNWHAGNANADGQPTRGWLLGHFLGEDGGIRASDTVEVKWGVHPLCSESDQPRTRR